MCSLSSSISTALHHPGLLPHQQHRLHGGGGAGRAAAGAAQAQPLTGLLQPAGTWDAASAGPTLGPSASPCTRHQLCSLGQGLCWPLAPTLRMLLPLFWQRLHPKEVEASVPEHSCGRRGGGEGLHPVSWAGWGARSPGIREVASSRLPQPRFLCLQDPVLQVLLSADLEGFQHFPSREEAGEALGCPWCSPGAGTPGCC